MLRSVIVPGAYVTDALFEREDVGQPIVVEVGNDDGPDVGALLNRLPARCWSRAPRSVREIDQTCGGEAVGSAEEDAKIGRARHARHEQVLAAVAIEIGRGSSRSASES